jgi:4-hydroxyacetophenone monooxygenase
VAAIRLSQAGVPFTVIEKNGDVGGTWWENTYPGARVDNSNHMYSYSFAQKVDWPYHFSTQAVLHDYFSSVADEYGVRPHVRFNTEVESMAFNDETATWTLQLRTGDGRRETMEANAVVSAVGQLNRPKMPEIKGLGSFEGPSFHSARWDHDVDLRGKRIAVIGNGASASQLIPIVAEEAGELLIFQRTPTWYVPVPHYHDPVPARLQWLFRHVPGYAQWYRFWLFWTSAEGLLPSARVDEGWDGNQESIGKANDELRMMLTGYLEGQFGDRPDLREKVIPKYAPASKRMVLDNGIWAKTLKRDNARLITESIAEITPRGVKTNDGEEYAVDVIIYGTGFQASRFLTPMKVTGRHGVDLNDDWGGDARAYLGITVPDFPNLFLMYGPNTNIVVNGSIIYFSECETNYIVGSLRMLLEGNHRAMDCRRDVHDEYNARVDEENMKMAWGVAEVPSWYRNEKGRSAQNWPFSLLEYWQRTREPNATDYEFL